MFFLRKEYPVLHNAKFNDINSTIMFLLTLKYYMITEMERNVIYEEWFHSQTLIRICEFASVI